MSAEGTSFAGETVIKTGENKYFVQHGTDKNLLIEFYTDAELQAFESERVGHSVYKDVEMIRIRTPGINGNTIERKVKMVSDGSSPSDIQRFPNQWQAFKNSQAQRPDGFPIEQWPVLTKSQVLTLKAQNIHVLEQIVGLPDTNLQLLGMEGRKMRDMAKSYLERDKSQELLAAATAERDSLRNDLESLRASVETLKGADGATAAQELAAARKEIEALKAAAASTPAKPKRGRPPNKSKAQENT